MASAPFKLTTSTPADVDTVSQFPALDRGDKDKVQSWILTDHNVDGTHTQATFVQAGTLLSDGTTTTAAPTPASNRTSIYRATDGALRTIRGEDSTVEFLGGVPPGAVIPYAGTSAPAGWLFVNGGAVSRTTYARLFTAIGTLYGVGDGSTTFNIPDLNGRIIIGRDGVGRVTAGGGNWDASVVASTGGLQNHTMTSGELVSHTHTFSGTAQTWNLNSQVKSTSIVGGIAFGGGSFNFSDTTPNVTVTPAGTISSTGSGTPFTIMPPSIVLNYIIKT